MKKTSTPLRKNRDLVLEQRNRFLPGAGLDRAGPVASRLFAQLMKIAGDPLDQNGSPPPFAHLVGYSGDPTNQQDIISINRKCLQHLLDNDIVEYYYIPDNDGSILDFTTRGITTKKRLSNETSKPLLVVRFVPSGEYNETILPRSICSSEIGNFMPNMMARDYDLARDLLRFFKHVAVLSGMNYFLNYGSLLGHVRFNNRPLPWDDDIDFSVDYSAVNRFERTFKRERRIHFGSRNDSPKFLPQLHRGTDRIKIFDETQNSTNPNRWTFPFLDLFFYSLPLSDFDEVADEAAFGIFESHVDVVDEITGPLSVALPLRPEVFLGVELMVPSNSSLFVELTNYDLSVCMTLSWSHRFERSRGTTDAVDCRVLEGFYDF